MFEEKIKNAMENYLHDGSNVITINSLYTIIANAIEKSNLAEAGFDEYGIFSPASFEEKISLMILCLQFLIIIIVMFSVHLLLRI